MRSRKWRFLWMILTGVVIFLFLHNVISKTSENINDLYNLITCIIITSLVWEGCLILDEFLNKKLPWENHTSKRILVQLISTSFYTVIIIYFSLVFFNTYICNIPKEKQANFMIPSVLIGLFTSIIILSIYISADFFEKWKKSLIELEEHKTAVAQSALNNLKNQVNPHFLFNNLSVLTSLIQLNPEKATQFVSQLSKVYRYLLDNKDNELTTLETELKFIQSYIFLLKIRYEEAFGVEINVDERLKNKKLPPLALQILLENAIKHNEISLEHQLHISLTNENEDYIVVKNKIIERSPPEQGSKTGLENMSKQIAFFTSKPMIINPENGVFTVKTPLI